MTSSENEVLIKVDNVSKKFCRDFKKSLWYGLKDTASDIFNFNRKEQEKELAQLREGEFWANQNISFEVKRGECLGLIGRNGAGKTTLLKMLNGLIKPDYGNIQMCGKVGAMIALSAGFNPILTGRENIYVNGSILGIPKKEIDSKISEIIDFAEIEDAIDAPVRTYSSGMQVRLGFAVSAILIRPDVLLLDEVLAVGDTGFRIKCFNAIDTLRLSSAVILVSHSLEHISRVTQRCLVLDNGKNIHLGSTESSLPLYKSLINNNSNKAQTIYTTGVIKDIVGPERPICRSEDIEIPFKVTLERPCKLGFRATIWESTLTIAAEMRGLYAPSELPVGISTLVLRIPKIQLQSGEYGLYINIYDENEKFIATSGKVATFQIVGNALGECSYQPDADIILV
jgi:ABC-type polysaccharide/polyol phosphate transport system ATPase subunit